MRITDTVYGSKPSSGKPQGLAMSRRVRGRTFWSGKAGRSENWTRAMSPTQRRTLVVLVVAAILALDQATKAWALATLQDRVIHIVPTLSCV